jgi:hypothetical protein
VADDRLVVEHKGIYSIENFITSRRLMYWQVYLHKTAVAAERLLVNMLLRAKELRMAGHDVFATPQLDYFLRQDVSRQRFCGDPEAMRCYAQLDDSDVWSAMKVWQHHPDRVLALLSTALLNRRLMKVEVYDEQQPMPPGRIDELRATLAKRLDMDSELLHYFMSEVTVGKDAYNANDDHIDILQQDGSLRDIAELSPLLSQQRLAQEPRKHYLCYYR